ncbi:MAG: uracil-DNA glycosylase [Thermodesulfobacteriota bacterium]
MDSKKELLDILGDLKSYLNYQQQMGLGRVLTDEPEKNSNKEVISPGSKEFKMGKENKKIIKIADQPDIFDSGKKQTLEEIREELGECTRCKLHTDRTNIVFGDGNPNARLVFVGEGPGRDEDMQGKPFVGRAGKLLTKIIEAMGLTRKDVYICNVVKCRPPNNRNPEADEVAACEPFLLKQIRSINPEIVVCLGSVATSLLLKMKQPRMGDLRGQFHEYGNSKLMITYHPAALLRNPNFKKPVWEDMKVVLKELKLPIPGD